MAKKSPGKSRQTIIARQIEVKWVALSVSRRVDKPRGLPPSFEGGPHLELRGTVNEAVRDVCDVRISVFLDDLDERSPGSPLSVGTIIQIRPHIVPVVRLPTADFDRAWALAAVGQLRYAWIAFTEPYRNSARVVSISFSNEFEE